MKKDTQSIEHWFSRWDGLLSREDVIPENAQQSVATALSEQAKNSERKSEFLLETSAYLIRHLYQSRALYMQPVFLSPGEPCKMFSLENRTMTEERQSLHEVGLKTHKMVVEPQRITYLSEELFYLPPATVALYCYRRILTNLAEKLMRNPGIRNGGASEYPVSGEHLLEIMDDQVQLGESFVFVGKNNPFDYPEDRSHRMANFQDNQVLTIYQVQAARQASNLICGLGVPLQLEADDCLVANIGVIFSSLSSVKSFRFR
jgi:hypothetical protein